MLVIQAECSLLRKLVDVSWRSPPFTRRTDRRCLRMGREFTFRGLADARRHSTPIRNISDAPARRRIASDGWVTRLQLRITIGHEALTISSALSNLPESRVQCFPVFVRISQRHGACGLQATRVTKRLSIIVHWPNKFILGIVVRARMHIDHISLPLCYRCYWGNGGSATSDLRLDHAWLTIN